MSSRHWSSGSPGLLFLGGLGGLLEISGAGGPFGPWLPHAFAGSSLDPVALPLDVDVQAGLGVSHQ